MKRKRIDLHVHSTISDGKLKPSEVLENAKRNNIDTLVFTEHNSLHDNIDKLMNYSNKIGVNIPFAGVEVNSVYCNKGEKILKLHLLIYGVHSENKEFLDYISIGNKAQNEYIHNLYDNLRANNIMKKKFKDICVKYSDEGEIQSRKKQFTRTMLAEEISSNFNINIELAKEKYLPKINSDNKYLEWLDVKDIIKKAKELKLVTVLAHPSWIRTFDLKEITFGQLIDIIRDLKSAGLDGIEVDHRLNNSKNRQELNALAKELNLIATGGSDFHGKINCKFGECLTKIDEFNKIMNKLGLEL